VVLEGNVAPPRSAEVRESVDKEKTPHTPPPTKKNPPPNPPHPKKNTKKKKKQKKKKKKKKNKNSPPKKNTKNGVATATAMRKSRLWGSTIDSDSGRREENRLGGGRRTAREWDANSSDRPCLGAPSGRQRKRSHIHGKRKKKTTPFIERKNGATEKRGENRSHHQYRNKRL